jgi:DNA-binding response OmpR family regulator
MATILIVEDAMELADAVEKELAADGHRILRAADGILGLELCRSARPSLVILDWMLPGMDGLEVLRRLRQDPQDNTAVLMLTARSEETDRVVGLEVGADDYLTKPFGMRELLARVHALLRRAARIQSTIQADRTGDEAEIQYGPFHLSPSKFLAECQGVPLELTRTEYKLLHLLMRNPGRVFSREYLLDSVWGEQHVPGDRSVDNAILRLRKKMNAFSDSIESVWGVGYRLRPWS